MTDTQGITQQATSSAMGSTGSRSILKPRMGHKGGASGDTSYGDSTPSGAAATKKRAVLEKPAFDRSGPERAIFDRAALVRAVFHELRMLQNQGAQFVFETRFEGNFSLASKNTAMAAKPCAQANENQAPKSRHPSFVDSASQKQGPQSEHFSFLKLADFLILGPGGKTLLLKLNYKRRPQGQRSPWHARLMTLGHTIAYVECETPLDGRERVRQLMETQGYAPEAMAGKSNARAKAQALFA